jgi:hypothetical protein
LVYGFKEQERRIAVTTHISARIAWHDSGWNGHICQNPEANTYCVGRHSYPGEMIAERRNLAVEIPLAGRRCKDINTIPPCIYSINGFGKDTIPAFAPPPSWFRDSTEIKRWDLPPATVAAWPYEEMYRDEVLNINGQEPKYDAKKRREFALEFFNAIKPDHSLIFYYANYSNPFSDNEENRYVIVGVSRVMAIGPELTWVNQSKKMEQNYGAHVWQRNITSHYPDQGLRLPYHAYLDQPDILEKILFVPDNPRHFKYATRHISDDGALGLIERLMEIVGTLIEIGDTHENWNSRQDWLASLMAELWQNRGQYPGLLRVWDYLRFREAIPFMRNATTQRNEQRLRDELFNFIAGYGKLPDGLVISTERIEEIQRTWNLLELAPQVMLKEVFPLLEIQTAQIRKILEMPAEVGLTVSISNIADNPYLLSEAYTGSDPDDQITFGTVDRGIYPSPELGRQAEYALDDWRRLRALCVEQLKYASQQTFLLANQVIDGVNRKLQFLPDWKRTQITVRHLELDKTRFEGALAYRTFEDDLYLYRKEIFEDERTVEDELRKLAKRTDINLRFPVTESHWREYLYDPRSQLAEQHVSDYNRIIDEQVGICQRIFRRPVSVLCGAAGTGKTTVVRAIIRAIEKSQGAGTSFLLLAPTGKAADRLRERTGKQAQTIHSFLAQKGWLEDNMIFRRRGGRREDAFTTYIIDESSMLDLSLLATLFRAVNWMSVQRLIFVGDPNQLPPIGTGKVFADLIDWLRSEMPEHVGELKTNMRQRLNELSGNGSGLLGLASIYTRREVAEQKDSASDDQDEVMLEKAQEGGDIENDLRILYWQDTKDLATLLIDTLVADMEEDTGLSFDPNQPHKLWTAAMTKDGQNDPETVQVVSPYRGELFGVDHLNQILQRHRNAKMIEQKGMLGGITYFDKVIQIVNRPKSRPISAYDDNTRKNANVEIFNGEIGTTNIHGFDGKKWRYADFRLGRFQVTFSRKEHLRVNYDSDTEVGQNLELAYAISVHKSQGSEFGRTYFILPKHKRGMLSRELFYTGLTRAQRHCTVLIQEDVSPLLSLRRRENSQLARINSSVFQFRPVPPEYQSMSGWYEEGKIHRTLTKEMVRSKSEVIIANILFERDIPFVYEMRLNAPDGTFYLPDFTLTLFGDQWYWEHLGMLHNADYRKHWEKKLAWYEKHGFANHLIVTEEHEGFDSAQVVAILAEKIGL